MTHEDEIYSLENTFCVHAGPEINSLFKKATVTSTP